MREYIDATPHSWIDQVITLELQGEVMRGGTASSLRGRLQDVSKLGVTVRHAAQSEVLERFYPWSAVRSIRLLSDAAPPEG